jgi:hypothetical protein
MATINIYNALPNSVSLHTDVAVNDVMDNDPDLNFVTLPIRLCPRPGRQRG